MCSLQESPRAVHHRHPDEDQVEFGSEVPAEAVNSFRVPPKADEYEWVWKVRFFGCHSECSSLIEPAQPEFETSKHTFFCELSNNNSVHAMGLLKCLGKYYIVLGLRPQSRLFRYQIFIVDGRSVCKHRTSIKR